jgi:hypothetical protein
MEARRERNMMVAQPSAWETTTATIEAAEHKSNNAGINQISLHHF